MMMHANNEGDPDNTNPPCQPSKYVRFLRSLTLFTIDVILWSLFWPRGTQFCCRTLGIVTVRYLLQGICLLCSYALYGTLLVQSGQEAPTFVSDSTSRLLGLPPACRRQKREASLTDLFRTRGDQPAPEVLDELENDFLEAIDRVKTSYSDEDVISTVEASWVKNQTKAKDDKLGNYTAVPSDEREVDSVNKPVSAIFNSTVVSEGQNGPIEEQKQVSLADSEKSGGLSMELNVTSKVGSQVEDHDGAPHQDHRMVEMWLQQNSESYSPVSSSNQSTIAVMKPEVKVGKPDGMLGGQVDDSFSSALNSSTLAGILSLKSHPKLFPANDGNGTEEEEQAKGADSEGYTEEEQQVINILLGCSYTVLALTMLLVLYVLLWSDFSICRARARYLLAEQNAEAQQGLAFQMMDIASDRESLRIKTRNLEGKLKEVTKVGDFAIRTGLDQEPEQADYTIDIRRNVNLKRGMDQAQLEEVRQNIKRNKAIVQEMSDNIDNVRG